MIQIPYTTPTAQCRLDVPCESNADLYRLADVIDVHFRNNWKPIDPRRWAEIVRSTKP